jgi:UDP-N-acetylmuramate--alanine ligase
VKHYHFIGVCGVSMSSLAKILVAGGDCVSGSDQNLSGHHAKNINRKIDFVIINGAIDEKNPELKRARRLFEKYGKPEIITRDLLLAQISNQYTYRICVAGCHGKSTTTAMIGRIFVEAGKNPTIHNGVKDGLRIGGKEYFITEACEFKRSFLSLWPTVAVITNVDADHLDCYKDLDDIKRTFREFEESANFAVKHETDIVARDLRLEADGKYSFVCDFDPNKYGDIIDDFRIKLNVYGRHNVDNAILAVKTAFLCGIKTEIIKKAIESYKGIDRRFEFISSNLVSDYAHHPNEIKTTIDVANTLFADKNYVIVFQPHTFSRTKFLFKEFSDVLSAVKNLIIFKTYSAREKKQQGLSGFELARAIKKTYCATVSVLKKRTKRYDAVILCGAGNLPSFFHL